MPLSLTPLFRATWRYAQFTRLSPLGRGGEGQAYAVSEPGVSRVEDGSLLRGKLDLVQYPRWRQDGLYLPDAHGIITTDHGDKVFVRFGGFVIPTTPDADRFVVTHWARFYAEPGSNAWLNEVVAFGTGQFVDEAATVEYFVAAPADRQSDSPDTLSTRLLGTAHWEYDRYEAIRFYGDAEGVGLSASTGRVEGGVLAGAWHGWHYPSYRRSGLYEVDAHAEIETPLGVVLNRHAGLATKPAAMIGRRMYHITQYSSFTTEIPALDFLNHALAIGVGIVDEPGIVRLSLYELVSRPPKPD